ncbi:lipase family protein [Nocardia alba]|uniref:Alpha-beta hydrolase superfamily lysophospholipase n=1 Tax=Nocardia alba TaxID=225051 RepID=A0A4R1FZX2_9NOCA|nr:lipase family protein [Nocardia alba]TCJ99422.1 alpha-beta hydrolase superfamily lysophospholipase [Nocardia alba]
MTVDAPTSTPLLPPDDPFYDSPPGLDALAPGTVVRSRPVDVALFGVIRQRITAWQLLYRTCDLDGAPEVSVTTVLLPWGAPARSRPLVSFQCAIDAVAPQCFPSYALRLGARTIGSIAPLELPIIAMALAQGWAVSVPDHEGAGGRFGAAREPGYRALDGIRAALGFAPAALSPTTSVALWGYSGGGLATAWAAELAAEYAPELKIVGAAAGSPVGDPAAAFVRLNGGWFAGFPAAFVAGLRQAYPELDPVLRDHLDARYHGLLGEAEQRSTFALLLRFARRDVSRHLRGGMGTLLAEPVLRRILADIEPGTRAPAAPLLVVQGVNDEVIAVADIDAHVRRYEQAGAAVRYLRVRRGSHLPLEFLIVPAVLDWLTDRFAGIPAPTGTCTVGSVARSPRALRTHVAFGGLALRMLAGLPIGGEGERSPERTRLRHSDSEHPHGIGDAIAVDC